jgi:hypothetical protein
MRWLEMRARVKPLTAERKIGINRKSGSPSRLRINKTAALQNYGTLGFFRPLRIGGRIVQALAGGVEDGVADG